MTDRLQNGYDATQDPRTGKPIFPEVESQPLTDADNQGTAIEEDGLPREIPEIGDEDDLTVALTAEEDVSSAPSHQ